MTEGYCVKCRKNVKIKNGVESKNKRGVNMVKGKCPVCSTTVCRIVGNK